jgi:hypothetical protein
LKWVDPYDNSDKRQEESLYIDTAGSNTGMQIRNFMKCVLIFGMVIITFPIVSSKIMIEDWMQFADGSISAPDFRFGAVGDWSCNSRTQDTIENILSRDVDLILGLGDYSYEDTADCWFDLIKPIESKIKIAIADQEVESAAKLSQYMDRFNLTSQYYSFDYYNVHFISMSTEIPFDIGSDQYTFVKNDLIRAENNQEIGWIVVYFHRPIYSVLTQSSLRNFYHPLFDQYGVDLVLYGNRHNYDRSYPLEYNSENPTNPIITDNNTNTYNDPSGEIYATVGTAGATLRQSLEKVPYIVSQYDEGNGFLAIDVLNGGTTFSGKFYANDGTIIDQFVITKSTSSMLREYRYEPYFSFVDSNFTEFPSNGLTDLKNFSVATWFNTMADYSDSAYIISKNTGGGSTNSINGSAQGDDLAYGIYLDSDERVVSEFSSRDGTKHEVRSKDRYNDGGWHYVVTTYDGSAFRLYVDGTEVSSILAQQKEPNISEKGSVRIGAGDLSAGSELYTGFVDEVRIWDRMLSTQEIMDAYRNGMFNTGGQLVHISSLNDLSPT